MPEYVRVKQNGTGHELSVTRAMYDFAPDAYTVLEDKAAADAGGNPYPAKLKTTVAKAAAKKAAKPRNSATSEDGQSADTEKEN